jgi:hypothetical protein
MKKLVNSSILILSFIICVSAQMGSDVLKIPASKSIQTTDKGALNKKTIVTNPKGQAPTNWSKIKDLFR